jgi:hypothetical protein
MTLEIAGMIFELFGTIFIAIAALSVHHRFLNEHRVDDKVLSSMKIEQKIGFSGIVMIAIGFFFQILEKII